MEGIAETLLITLHIRASETLRPHWSISDPRHAEAWGQGICLLEAWYFIDDSHIPITIYRWLRKIPALANSPIGKASGIVHYRLGEQP